MSLFLSPIGNDQFVDANGDPLTGGQIETYLNGSSTPAATYTSSAGTTPQANPVILNTLGAPASPIWLTGGIAYKFVIKDSSGVTLRTIDDISGVNDASVSQSEWVESGLVPTYISATSFSVPGDQTPILQIGRRLRTTNTSGLVYSTISNSVFAAGITTVTLTSDSTTLDAGLSLVGYALLAATPLSVPKIPISSGGTGLTDGSNLLPAGVVATFARNSAPTGWLKANGAVVSRTTYATLFAAIGTTFNTGGEAGTDFRLPELRGEFIRGWDDARGIDSGRVFGSAQGQNIQSHFHTIFTGTVSGGTQSGIMVSTGATDDVSGTRSKDVASVTPTETRPRNVALLACIKF